MLSTKRLCDFCLSAQLKHQYTPINTARGMEVYVCGHCGLVQSISTKAYPSRPPGSMSADANRSSYRYTKDLISDRHERCFSEFVEFPKLGQVLDVGSNRGAFVRYLRERSPGAMVTAIEPDASITASYSALPGVALQPCRFEHAVLPNNHFDFAYCAHTLEHAASARQMLQGILRALKPNGLLFLAVPNLLFHQDIIEELFIDPHTYHFTFSLLRDFATQMGFTVVYSSEPLEAEVVLLLRKQPDAAQEPAFAPMDQHLAQKTTQDITGYMGTLRRNRAKLKDSAQRLNKAGTTHKVVIWGGGRIFDALVRSGGLDLTKIHLVVDKYLYRYVKQLHGCRLESPDALEGEAPESILVYIASREYADEIQAEASALGITNFIKFGETTL